MKTIPLTRGLFALVDDADFERVNAHQWYAHKGGRGFYAARTIRKLDGQRTALYLHHFLMPGVPRVDHRDGNSLNDQMENLRPATHRQNMQGFKRKQLDTTSKFRGVDWNRKSQKWVARICFEGRRIYLGGFLLEEDAARAFDVAARKYRGEFAHLNFP